ncbi:helix-turn-helix domain-containing protein [Haloarchaeobius sp. DT45]|uniref:helix-turn-helix domain-containing protein n=1 Tax=Haloarchaeobius sp. DT45 TaxID=3446116 RepID=UPI003F6A77E4
MTVHAEFAIETTELGMGETLAAFPDAALDVAQVARTPQGTLKLDFWLTGVEADVFQTTLDEDTSVESTRVVCGDGARTLFTTVLTEERLRALYDALVLFDGQLLTAHCRNGQWNASFRFPDRGSLTTFESELSDAGLSVTVTAIESENGTCGPERDEPLTDEQQEALRVALDAGYFAVPRQANLGDVATELEISSQAASERLRRGLVQLVESQVE